MINSKKIPGQPSIKISKRKRKMLSKLIVENGSKLNNNNNLNEEKIEIKKNINGNRELEDTQMENSNLKTQILNKNEENVKEEERIFQLNLKENKMEKINEEKLIKKNDKVKKQRVDHNQEENENKNEKKDEKENDNENGNGMNNENENENEEEEEEEEEEKEEEEEGTGQENNEDEDQQNEQEDDEDEEDEENENGENQEEENDQASQN